MQGEAGLVEPVALRTADRTGGFTRWGPLGTLSHVDAGPQGTAWEVHDGGSRLTNERISQLFRPFTRSDEPVERRGSGAGLGLTLAKAYAQVIGGEVGGRAD